MRKFVIQSIAAAGLLLAVDVAVIVVRVALAQKDAAAAFAVPPETEVVFIGNSHTGCTFTEASEFRNRVVWRHATGFTLHYLRFLELERRGAFDGNVKACVVDCDWPALDGCSRKCEVSNFLDCLPVTWRYWDKTLLTKGEILRAVLTHPGREFYYSCETPPPEVPNWTTRTAEERANLMKPMDPNARTFRRAGNAFVDYPHDWQSRVLDMIRDMKERCDRHGVRLILFAAPLASDAGERTNPDTWALVTEFAARVRALGVEYCDFRLAYPDEKFRDAGHLLLSTSYEFTKRFYAEVLKIPVGN